MTARVTALPTPAPESHTARVRGLMSQARTLSEELLTERLDAATRAALGLTEAAEFELPAPLRDRLRRVGAQLAAEIDSINSQRMRSGG